MLFNMFCGQCGKSIQIESPCRPYTVFCSLECDKINSGQMTLEELTLYVMSQLPDYTPEDFGELLYWATIPISLESARNAKRASSRSVFLELTGGSELLAMEDKQLGNIS